MVVPCFSKRKQPLCCKNDFDICYQLRLGFLGGEGVILDICQLSTVRLAAYSKIPTSTVTCVIRINKSQ